MMDYVYAFNAFEAALWCFMALNCFIDQFRDRRLLKRPILTVAVFLTFACSEVIEMQTGAWWRPLWLMFLKGGCILSLIVLGVENVRAIRVRREEGQLKK